jgi:hypothetical protein
MTETQINFCPFCGNELEIKDEFCPFCNRDISLLFSEHVLETNAARRILGCLSAMPKDFGRYVLASVLRGSASPVILDNDLDQNPYYGDLGKLSKKDIINMIDALIEKGFIDTVVKEEEIFNIRISNRGELGLDGKDIAWVPLPFPLHNQLEPIFTPQQKAVMPELRSMRSNLAHANNIPPYMVFNDDTLKDIALKLPSNVEELEGVKGIKEVKAKKYSKEILETVQWALEDFDRRGGLDEDEVIDEETGNAVSDIFDELEEMKSIVPIVDTGSSGGVSLNSMLHPAENDAEPSETEVFPLKEETVEGEPALVMKIPVRRIAISRETGEELNICEKCGGYYHISLDFCPHCDDIEEGEDDEEEPELEGDGIFETDEDDVEDIAENETTEAEVIELEEVYDEANDEADDDADEANDDADEANDEADDDADEANDEADDDADEANDEADDDADDANNEADIEIDDDANDEADVETDDDADDEADVETDDEANDEADVETDDEANDEVDVETDDEVLFTIELDD